MKRNGFEIESTGETHYGLSWKELSKLKKDIDEGYERFWRKRGGAPRPTGFSFSPRYKKYKNTPKDSG